MKKRLNFPMLNLRPNLGHQQQTERNEMTDPNMTCSTCVHYHAGAYGEGTPAMEAAAKTVSEFAKSKQVADTLTNLAYELHNQLYRGLEDNLASDLNSEAAKRAENLLMKVLRGNEDAAKELFKCGNDGNRREACGLNTGRPWAKLINGHLLQTSAVELRAAIVEAHSELLKNERILDLEAAVEGLKAQLKKLQEQT